MCSNLYAAGSSTSSLDRLARDVPIALMRTTHSTPSERFGGRLDDTEVVTVSTGREPERVRRH
jgi:hypothetical protein